MNKSSYCFCLFAAIALVLIAFPCSAGFQESGESPLCKEDIAKFCPSVKPGEGRIMKCLSDHEADLSPECRKRTEDIRKRHVAWQNDCSADVAKFCPDIKPGGGRIIRCILKHEKEISEPCRKRVEDALKGKVKQQEKMPPQE